MTTMNLKNLPLSVLISVAAVLVLGIGLGAYAVFGPKPEPRPAMEDEAESRPWVVGPVTYYSMSDLPDWVQVARQRDCDLDGRCLLGEVKFNRQTVVRNADRTADAWVQVEYAIPRRETIETADSVIRLTYQRERLKYRLNCDTGHFMILERLLLDENETLLTEAAPDIGFRRPSPGGAADQLKRTACYGR